MWFLVLGCHCTTPFSGALEGKNKFLFCWFTFQIVFFNRIHCTNKSSKMYSLKINYYYYYNKLLPEVLSGSIILEDKGLSLCLKDTEYTCFGFIMAPDGKTFALFFTDWPRHSANMSLKYWASFFFNYPLCLRIGTVHIQHIRIWIQTVLPWKKNQLLKKINL